MVHAWSLLDHPSKSMPMMTQQSMPIPKMKDIALPFGESLMICQSCSRTQSCWFPLCHHNRNMLCFHSYTRIPATNVYVVLQGIHLQPLLRLLQRGLTPIRGKPANGPCLTCCQRPWGPACTGGPHRVLWMGAARPCREPRKQALQKCARGPTVSQ
jgi:hypothetical protein